MSLPWSHPEWPEGPAEADESSEWCCAVCGADALRPLESSAAQASPPTDRLICAHCGAHWILP